MRSTAGFYFPGLRRTHWPTGKPDGAFLYKEMAGLIPVRISIFFTEVLESEGRCIDYVFTIIWFEVIIMRE